MFGTVVALAFPTLVAVATISWLAIGFYGAKAIRQARPEIALWSRATGWNPTNVLLRPELLTVEGQVYRGQCIRAVIVFVACIVVALALGAITRMLR